MADYPECDKIDTTRRPRMRHDRPQDAKIATRTLPNANTDSMARTRQDLRHDKIDTDPEAPDAPPTPNQVILSGRQVRRESGCDKICPVVRECSCRGRTPDPNPETDPEPRRTLTKIFDPDM